MKVQHIYREANRAADLLASLGHSLSLGLHVYSEPPDAFWSILAYDLRDVAFPHLICEFCCLGFCPIYSSNNNNNNNNNLTIMEELGKRV